MGDRRVTKAGTTKKLPRKLKTRIGRRTRGFVQTRWWRWRTKAAKIKSREPFNQRRVAVCPNVTSVLHLIANVAPAISTAMEQFNVTHSLPVALSQTHWHQLIPALVSVVMSVPRITIRIVVNPPIRAPHVARVQSGVQNPAALGERRNRATTPIQHLIRRLAGPHPTFHVHSMTAPIKQMPLVKIVPIASHDVKKDIVKVY